VSGTSAALFVAVFIACVVEAVEATTIVLAAGTARDWRSATTGMFTGLGVLAVITAALGPAVTALPLQALRLFVGALLLIFGLQWLRKAILRASGHKALHDEDAIYREQVAAAAAGPAAEASGAARTSTAAEASGAARTSTAAEASGAARTSTARRAALVPDMYGFTIAFKGVLLEGLEVVFIALTFGTNARDVPLAAIAAGAAVLVVAAVGVVIRAPLARVPENTMKFAVGVMLTGFGTFWGAEGAGARWPGSDAALLAIVPAIAAFALLMVAVMRRAGQARAVTVPTAEVH
jgi:uncharacterized membrane protein